MQKSLKKTLSSGANGERFLPSSQAQFDIDDIEAKVLPLFGKASVGERLLNEEESISNTNPLPENEKSLLREKVQRILPPKPQTNKFVKRQGLSVLLQEWEGVVVEVLDDSFLCRLADLRGKEPEHVAELPIQEISLEDRSFLREGGIFYWYVGYSDDRVGTRRRVSELRFRRLPAWSRRDLTTGQKT